MKLSAIIFAIFAMDLALADSLEIIIRDKKYSCTPIEESLTDDYCLRYLDPKCAHNPGLGGEEYCSKREDPNCALNPGKGGEIYCSRRENPDCARNPGPGGESYCKRRIHPDCSTRGF
ncbi:MAG: hypothetical protein BroJett040_07390 [Oligoflexia bacterium]|nr:MAG: hypothetical protein BroJett040_07390 [Oligoflexia bacterium]